MENRRGPSKLHEVALGLPSLHTKHRVVHGGLKCNDVAISADGKAKLADVLLKNEQEEPPPIDEVGPITWKPPKVISLKTRETFAPD